MNNNWSNVLLVYLGAYHGKAVKSQNTFKNSFCSDFVLLARRV